MPATWFLIQYTHDLRRQEPRNVGIAVEAPDGWHLRFLGETEGGSVDGHKARAALLDRSYFESWIDYYRRHAFAGEWNRVLEFQKKRPNNIAVSLGGIHLEEVLDWEHFTTLLFHDVVDAGHERPNDVLDSKVRRLFKDAGISPQEGFEVEGLWTPRGRPHKIHFDYGMADGTPKILEKVRLRRNPVYSFKGRMDAVTRYHPDARFVALTSWAANEDHDKLDEILSPLEEQSHPINLEDPRAPKILREVLAA